MEDLNVENLVNEVPHCLGSGEIELTDEDKVISLEGITAVEKRFINFTRIFACQEWLEELCMACVDKVADGFISNSVEDKALHEIVDEYQSQGFPYEALYGGYLAKCHELENNQEYMNNTTDFWITQVAEDISGDLVELDEN